ncbi:MAG: GGDEF domain-containing protein [Dethiosulfatibacter sp.]|nr:GGDEF domain-containing protein [Dethiosulfatibacter sp.]
MKKLNIFVCENYFPEISSIIEREKLEDVIVQSFPSMCENKKNVEKTTRLIEEFNIQKENGLVLCSRYCDVLKLIPIESSLEARSSNYCFSHLLNEQMIDYIIRNGGYIIGSGWLNSWRARIAEAGFDQQTAKIFYHDFCKELIYFNTGIDPHHEKDMIELSEYLDLPFVIIPMDMDNIKIIIRSLVHEWRLKNLNQESKQSLLAVQAQCAEYSAILDMMGKIAAYTNKRETIEKIKEIFTILFGARDFKYWTKDESISDYPEFILNFFEDKEKLFTVLKEQDKFCIKIQWNEKLYGAIDVGSFLFPEYTDKYLNFAIEIARISGLALSNIDQFEKLTKSEQKLQYLSYHDALTGLHNRTYINDFIKKQSREDYFTVFMFDVDRLKYTNDNFGHSEGDKLIIAVADILTRSFRETDTVARIGGDEFVAILKNSDFKLTNDIKARIREEIRIYNHSCVQKHLEVGLSIGFAISESNEESIETLMTKADELMYANKLRNRN